MNLSTVLLLTCVALPAITATLLTTAATGTTAAVTIGLTTTAINAATAVNAAAAAATVGAAAVVGALAAGAISRGRRGRRDVSEVSCAGAIESEELLFVLAANSDQLGCGQRLVCELEATEDQDLSSVEQSILSLFGRNVRPLKASQMLQPKSLYHFAAQVGSKASSPLECGEVFDLCPMDRQAIMAVYGQFAAATGVTAETAAQ